jgi:hypothetical protein
MLTLGVYMHVELADQTAAIQSLPGPPGTCGRADQLDQLHENGLSVHSGG